MKLFITGGNSFLGQNLLPILTENKINFWAPGSKEIDLLDFNKFNQAVATYKSTAILHMAALCAGIGGNLKRPADFIWDNSQMALNVFKAAKNCNVKKVYSLGSVCSYPVNCPIPFKENDILNGRAEETNEPYGNSKRLLLSLSESFRKQYDIGGAFLIPVNMFGNHDHFDLENSHVIPALINKFVTAVKNKEEKVYCWGSGTASREFLYASDCARAIVKAIVTGLDTELPINLGTGQEITIKDLATLIGELTGFKGEIIFTNEVSDGQPRRCLDVSRAKELLDWNARTSLREGLEATIKWYSENY